ncbi:9519_t:CDS:2 [Dentiscutata erythropus]|uniref:9519_t:CDS:1 n=1 Tax=Dentiscutata erythropus TaxID=1348616 RepID=A0A9N9BKK9_9GLOM|nr:9519_t:CDS:2 [Dentiscutata erythropus]
MISSDNVHSKITENEEIIFSDDSKKHDALFNMQNDQFPYLPLDVLELDCSLGYVINAINVFMYLIEQTNAVQVNKTRSLIYFMDKMKHVPYIQHLIDVIEDENYLAIVWEDPGQPMFELLQNAGHNLNFQEIFCQICLALANLHENNLAHMSLNCDTLWIKNNNVKIVDFASLGHFTTANLVHIVQTLNPSSYDIFTPPEIIERQPCWGWRPDVWALGVVFYYTIVGQFPCDGDYVRFHQEIKNGSFSFPEEMDPSVCDLLSCMWDPDPTKKFDMWDVIKHPFLAPQSTPLINTQQQQQYDKTKQKHSKLKSLLKFPKKFRKNRRVKNFDSNVNILHNDDQDSVKTFIKKKPFNFMLKFRRVMRKLTNIRHPNQHPLKRL